MENSLREMAPSTLYKVRKSELFLSRIIGRGAYSTVYLGRIRNHAEQGAVTIKVPKGSTESDVIREIKRMASLHHPNIIRLVGIAYGNCGDGSNPEAPMTWMLMDYASKGDLVDFINYRAGMQLPLDVPLWTKLSLGIAQGMQYLHENLIVHCDLHTKNCFVDQNYVAKVGDFGLSYRLESNEEEAKILQGPGGVLGRPKGMPSKQIITGIRWKGPEYIPGDNFQAFHLRPGDVWAYGILLYELWSEGKIPFEPIGSNKEVSEVIADGKNPQHFDQIDAPRFITVLMEDCFAFPPNSRPKFDKIIQTLQEAQVVVGIAAEEPELVIL